MKKVLHIIPLLMAIVMMAMSPQRMWAGSETAGYTIVTAGNAESLLSAIKNAKKGDKIFLPNGTYDLGKATLTTISTDSLSIIGESMEGTIIKNTPDNAGLATTATLCNTSTGLYLQDLTIQNALDYYSASTDASAVCLQDNGTKTICKNVRMLSCQNTYYSNKTGAVKYFDGGELHGTVDIISGDGSVYFNKVGLVCEKRQTSGGGSDVITASNAADTDKGFVLNGCTIKFANGITGTLPVVSLGRAWNNAPQCVYLNTMVDDKNGEVSFQDDPYSPTITRWTIKVMNKGVFPKLFGEYNTVNTFGDCIISGSNQLTFKDEGGFSSDMETSLTAEQAAKYTIDYVLGDWAKDAQTDATQVKEIPSSPEGLVYLIPGDGTTDSYITTTCPKTGLVRIANGRGGFGPEISVVPLYVTSTLNGGAVADDNYKMTKAAEDEKWTFSFGETELVGVKFKITDATKSDGSDATVDLGASNKLTADESLSLVAQGDSISINDSKYISATNVAITLTKDAEGNYTLTATGTFVEKMPDFYLRGLTFGWDKENCTDANRFTRDGANYKWTLKNVSINDKAKESSFQIGDDEWDTYFGIYKDGDRIQADVDYLMKQGSADLRFDDNFPVGTYDFTVTKDGDNWTLLVKRCPIVILTKSDETTTGYTTLAAALAAADDGSTIMLIEDINETVTITYSNYITGLTINLNGHTLSGINWETIPCYNLTDEVYTVYAAHSLGETEGVPATCTTAGSNAYWTCSKCGKHFSDKEGKTETTLDDLATPALGHKFAEDTENHKVTCSNKGCTFEAPILTVGTHTGLDYAANSSSTKTDASDYTTLYYFKATDDGALTITDSSDDGGSFGALFNADMSDRLTSDGDGNGSCFKLTYEVTKDSVYWIGARSVSGDALSNHTLTIAFAAVSVTTDGVTTSYETFPAALAAAEDGSTITLLKDMTIESGNTAIEIANGKYNGRGLTIDLGKNTLALIKTGWAGEIALNINGGNRVTIKNGTLDINGFMCGISTSYDLILDGVNVDGTGLSCYSADGTAPAKIVIRSVAAYVNLTNSTITAPSGQYSYYSDKVDDASNWLILYGNNKMDGNICLKNCILGAESTDTITHCTLYVDDNSVGALSIDHGEFTAPAGCVWSEENPDGQRTLLSLTLSEETDPTYTLVDLALISTPQDITIGRTLYKDGYYNTLCLPFSLTAEQLAASPLAGCTLKAVKDASMSDDVSTMTINLSDTTAIEAGMLYLIKWANDTKNPTIENPLFKGVSVTVSNASFIMCDNLYIVGNFAPTRFDQTNAENANMYFLGGNNQFYYADKTANLKGFRWFVYYLGGMYDAKSLNIVFNDDNIATVVGTERIAADKSDAVYNLNGQKLSAPRRGLNIINGRKVMVK